MGSRSEHLSNEESGVIIAEHSRGSSQRVTPPKLPSTNGMVERFQGLIEEALHSHHFRSGEELETTLHGVVWLYNQQLTWSALGSKSPLQAMKDWLKFRPELFKEQR